MIRLAALLTVAALPGIPLMADTVVAARTIRAGEVIGTAHVTLEPAVTPGAARTEADVIGLEARRMIYPGRPVMPADIGPPAVFERNAIVSLLYRRGALVIRAEGRALSRGGVGDRVRVLNLGSRQTIRGVVAGDGTVVVDGSD